MTLPGYEHICETFETSAARNERYLKLKADDSVAHLIRWSDAVRKSDGFHDEWYVEYDRPIVVAEAPAEPVAQIQPVL